MVCCFYTAVYVWQADRTRRGDEKVKRTCRECGKEFELNEGEIQFYNAKNLELPKRCKECRDKKKNNGRSYDRQSWQKPAGRKSGGRQNQNTRSQPGSGKRQAVRESLENERRSAQKAEPENDRIQEQNAGQSTGAESGWQGPGAVKSTGPEYGGRQKGDSSKSQNNHVPNSHNGQPQAYAAAHADPVQPSAGTGAVKQGKRRINTIWAAVIIFMVLVSGLFGNRFLETESDQTSGNSVQDASNQGAQAYHFRNDQYLTEHFEKHGGDFTYDTKEAYEEGANRVISSSEALHKLEAEDGDDVYYLESTNEFVIVSVDGYIRTYFKPQ